MKEVMQWEENKRVRNVPCIGAMTLMSCKILTGNCHLCPRRVQPLTSKILLMWVPGCAIAGSMRLSAAPACSTLHSMSIVKLNGNRRSKLSASTPNMPALTAGAGCGVEAVMVCSFACVSMRASALCPCGASAAPGVAAAASSAPSGCWLDSLWLIRVTRHD